jgi:ribosomal protein S18 acetylase RimI-like enzyme
VEKTKSNFKEMKPANQRKLIMNIAQQKTNIGLRHIAQRDIPAIKDITYLTGHMGEGLIDRDIFNDKHLFALIFNLYYALYEPEHYFVAVDSEDIPIGFVCGTTDTLTQERKFILKMGWRILARALLISSWRYPESIRIFIRLIKTGASYPLSTLKPLFTEYPAHLHINIKPGHQRLGIGSILLTTFEDHLRKLKIPAVHLGTTNYNNKALPFYAKHGYKILAEVPVDIWPGTPGQKTLFLGKKLSS